MSFLKGFQHLKMQIEYTSFLYSISRHHKLLELNEDARKRFKYLVAKIVYLNCLTVFKNQKKLENNEEVSNEKMKKKHFRSY